MNKPRKGSKKWQLVQLKRREYNLRTHYDLTLDRVNEMVMEQGGCCAVCDKPFGPTRVPQVDHDHATGAVRGLLCKECNTTLGRFGDSVVWLVAALRYLTVPKK